MLGEFISQPQKLDIRNSPHTCLIKCHYNQQAFRRDYFSIYNIFFPSKLYHAVHKRQAEYLAGRYAAKLALGHLGISNTIVGSNKHRAPVWPKNIVGSIAHTSEKALCAVALKEDVQFLGIDLENWISLDIVEKIADTVLSDKEQELLVALNCDYERAFTLAYSAKESLFKAIYPTVGRYFEFKDVELTKLSKSQKTFEMELRNNLSSARLRGGRFRGVYVTDTKGILTCIFQNVE